MSVDGSSVLVWPLVLGASLAWFLLPGLLGAAALSRRGVVPETAVALTAVALSSALGYAVFWAYLAGPGAGRVASLAGTAAAAVALSRPGARRLLARTVRSPAVAVPLGLLFVVALFYNAILFAHASSTPVELRARTHLMRNDGLPIDNDLPRLLAARLAEGRDPRPIYPEWQSSDRPPLQTGAVLLQRPFASALGIEALHYQLLATALQCSWVAAVWALGAAFRFRPAGTALALAAATFSGFFFVNSLYVWPKLYAGALALLALVLLVGRRPSPATAAVAALGAALGLLAHAGVVFTLVPVAAFVVARRTRPPLVPALAGAAVVVVLMAPWWAYTRFYDPPGDRLTKRHLAGVLQADGRPLSAALADAYSRSEPSELVRNKWENLDALVEAPPGWRELRQGGAERVRAGEFFVLNWALGPLNLAWPLLAAGLARHRRMWARRHWRGAVAVLGVGAGAVLFWALAMFGPGTTQVHHGSYATMILLWAGLAGVTASWSGRAAAALAAVHVAWFAAVWAAAMPVSDRPVGVADAVLAVVAGAAVLAALWRVGTAPPPDGGPDDGAVDDRPAPVEQPRDVEVGAGAAG